MTTSDKVWQRVVQRVAMNDNEWQRMTTSGTTSDNEWYNEWQRVVQRVTTNDNEWQRVVQRVTTSDNEWQWVVILANFLFFREEITNRHPKENPLNLEEDLEEDLLH